MTLFRITVALLLVGFLSVLAYSETSDVSKPTVEQKPSLKDSSKTEPRFIVRCERLTISNMKLNDTLDIIIESYGNPFAGFVLKFGTTSPYLDIVDVLPGEISDSCNWEFFRARQIEAGSRTGIPLVLWQVTALAKSSPDTATPLCYGFDRPASLLRLVVSSEHVVHVPDTTAPIFFYWEDCRDNVLSNATGVRLAISKEVIDFYPVDLPGEQDVFPTRFGTPRQCIKPTVINPPARQVEFHNGGVEFRLDMGELQTDSLSDSM